MELYTCLSVQIEHRNISLFYFSTNTGLNLAKTQPIGDPFSCSNPVFVKTKNLPYGSPNILGLARKTWTFDTIQEIYHISMIG